MKSRLLFVVCLFSVVALQAQTNALKNGQKNGVWNYYGINKSQGILLARHFYNEGVPTGIWEFYNIKGALSWTYNFNTATANYILENTAKGFYAYQDASGKYVKQTPTQKTIWLSSESQWNNFLVNNLKYHEESVPARVPGKVEIRVYVDENGKVTDYKLGNDVESDMNKDALRVTKLFGPEFVPAQNNGQRVKSIYTLLVSYKLADYR
jgi:Gram-negative bacterial TonB protein C-terminal